MYTYWEKPLEDFHANHPLVNIVTLTPPSRNTNNLSKHETFVRKKGITRTRIAKSIRDGGGRLVRIWDGTEYTDDELLEMLESPPYYYDDNGVLSIEDVQGKHVNAISAGNVGHRITTGTPDSYNKTIFLFGGCKVYGIGVPDNQTLASHLQKTLSMNSETAEIRVQNYGSFLKGHYSDYFPIINSVRFKPGDIAIIQVPLHIKSPWIHKSNLSKLFRRPHNFGEVFFDNGHYSERGYEAYATALYDDLRESGLLAHSMAYNNIATAESAKTPTIRQHEAAPTPIEEKFADELDAYKEEISTYRVSAAQNVGAIVMNCNPFTLGHRYLIETVAKLVDELFIFVVQEDKSFFPYEDRLMLVRAGTTDLENVTVLPSGKFIISALTFTDYFGKSDIQDRVVDTSQDVAIFGKHIAPTLGITTRFVGEEPLDNITRQYNQSMKEILPEYGVDVTIIPRKEESGAPISASRVRALLKDRDFESIAKLVPITTLDYLKEHF
jgi:[citrate (pro-3S)-lyase] ligase